jgi:hypothetical protein
MSASACLETNAHPTSTRNVISAFLFIWALILPLSTLMQAAAPSPKDSVGSPGDTFSILLQGQYQPVVHGPNLGLSQVNLSDGSFSTTKIFGVSGLPEHDSRGDHGNEKSIGNFYVQFGGSLVAYDLPGGALSMMFTGRSVQQVPDGEGGDYIVGTFDLNILEATGVYGSFAGGHNRMVDILHRVHDGTFVEHCICIIRRA